MLRVGYCASAHCLPASHVFECRSQDVCTELVKEGTCIVSYSYVPGGTRVEREELTSCL